MSPRLLRVIRRFRIAGLVVSAGLGAGCQSLFFHAVNAGSHGSPATYLYDEPHALKLDVYRPREAAGPLPVVLFFYGGSWRRGQRGEYAFVGRALAARGIVAVIPDYRKVPVAAFPAFEEDAATAARWTFDHAAAIGGDPRRVFVAGHSAGAHIAVLLASDARYLALQNLTPRDFAGAIGIAGPYDFLPLTDPDLIEVFGPRANWPDSQPINFIGGDEPPFLLIQGQGDRIVDPRNADALAARIAAAGEPVSVRRYPSVGHFRIVAAMRFTALAPTLEDVVRFVQETPVDAARRGANNERLPDLAAPAESGVAAAAGKLRPGRAGASRLGARRPVTWRIDSPGGWLVPGTDKIPKYFFFD